MSTIPALGPQAELHFLDRPPIELTTVEPGDPYLATTGPRIPLRLNTSNGGHVDVVISDPAWIAELLIAGRQLEDRARGGLFGGRS